MKARRLWMTALVAALALGGAAHALEGTNGFALDPNVPLLTNDDVESLAEWGGFDFLSMNGGPNGATTGNDAIAVDTSNRVYSIVVSQTPAEDLRYDGVVRIESDGTGLETLLQWENTWVGSDAEGWTQYGHIRALDVTHVHVPSTGSLEERLVVVRESYDTVLDGMVKEVMAYELEAGADGTYDGELLFDWPSGIQRNVHIATDASTGDLYVLEAIHAGDTTNHARIRRLAWSAIGGTYVETAVTSSNTAYTDLIYLNGKLYTFDADSRIDSRGSDAILEVDPTGFDVYAAHAYVKDSSHSDPNNYYGWAAAEGVLYAAAWTEKKTRDGFVTAVAAGATLGTSDAIATFGVNRLYAMDGAGDGSMVLLVGGGIHRLAPTSDGGGDTGGDTGSGGGGKGGGKGKNK